jgi:hypothetical protein
LGIFPKQQAMEFYDAIQWRRFTPRFVYCNKLRSKTKYLVIRRMVNDVMNNKNWEKFHSAGDQSAKKNSEFHANFISIIFIQFFISFSFLVKIMGKQNIHSTLLKKNSEFKKLILTFEFVRHLNR